MASELHVDAIKHSGGTSALTIDSSGNVHKAGMVVQVQRTYTATSGHISTTSTSYVASGIQCSITPKFSNSLILVDFVVPRAFVGSSEQLYAKMYIKVGSASIGAMSSASDGHGGCSANGTDGALASGQSYTATSTDTLLFEPYYKSGGGGNAYLVHNGSSISLTVTEIAQ